MDDLGIIKMQVGPRRPGSERADLDSFVDQGLLQKVGSNYYADDLDVLPETVREKIRAVKPSKYGLRLDFYVERQPRHQLMTKLGEYL